jgi:hypothetical protein
MLGSPFFGARWRDHPALTLPNASTFVGRRSRRGLLTPGRVVGLPRIDAMALAVTRRWLASLA